MEARTCPVTSPELGSGVGVILCLTRGALLPPCGWDVKLQGEVAGAVLKTNGNGVMAAVLVR